MPNKPKTHRPHWMPTRAQQRSEYDARRGEAAEQRGSARWQNYRAWFKRKHPMCCNPFGLEHHIEATQDVHHIVPVHEAPHRLCDESNTVPLCRPCHTRVSTMERMERTGQATEARALFRAWVMQHEQE